MSKLSYRPATVDDAALAADVMTAAYPDLPEDPVIVRYRWAHPRQSMSIARFIAEQDGCPVSYLTWFHGPWDRDQERYCEVEVHVVRSALSTELAAELFSWISAKAAADGASRLIAYAAEDETEMLTALASIGFERHRVARLWELDLRANGARLIEEARRARREAEGAGIRFETFAAWTHPEKVELLHQLDVITRQDIPHTAPIITDTIEDFQRRLRGPGRHDDRCWVALHDNRPVSFSYLFFPPVRGPVSTGYTCTHPDHRGHGLARATKLQSLGQAVELGVELAITDNDSENAPMLHINEKLGYRLRPGFVGHLKRVDKESDA
jgi:GNAT superfamily N-acetyltransferase